jgi:hypothetical protein
MPSVFTLSGARGRSLRGLRGTSVKLNRHICDTFQHWWGGMGDPLYAVLSRTCWGGSPTLTADASEAEIDRLCETAAEVAKDKDYTPSQRTAARQFAKRRICKW